MKYITYSTTESFYTINEIIRLFEMEKETVREYAKKFDIHPVRDQYDRWGYPKHLLRKLHNAIYKELKRNQPESDPYMLFNDTRRVDDPWA